MFFFYLISFINVSICHFSDFWSILAKQLFSQKMDRAHPRIIPAAINKYIISIYQGNMLVTLCMSMYITITSK